MAESVYNQGKSGVHQSPKIALVVLGMHRSGTSALTRALSLLGASLPLDLIPAGPDNPRGYWESQSLCRIHQDVAWAAGVSWRDVGFQTRFLERLERDFGERIATAMRIAFADSNFFALKDPRISRFVPLIASALQRIGAEPKFIIALRNPLEVAASLRKRNQLHLATGLMLWLEHTLLAERDTRAFNRSVVSYDDLLADWRKCLLRASQQLEVTFPTWDENEIEIDLFIDRTMRHNSYDDEELRRRDDVVPWIKTAFAALGALKEGHAGSQIAALDRVFEEFQLARSAFGPLLTAEREMSGLLNRKLSDLSAVFQEREAEFNSRAIQFTSRISLLERNLQTRSEELLRVTSDSLSHTARLATCNEERAKQEGRIKALESSRSWRITRPLRSAATRLRCLFTRA